MELREIGNDVYACLQEDTGLGKSNSGLVNRGGGLIEVLACTARISPVPVPRKRGMSPFIRR